jgi:hypothetical protein
MLVTLVSEGTASVHANIKVSSLSRHAITRSRPLLKGMRQPATFRDAGRSLDSSTRSSV